MACMKAAAKRPRLPVERDRPLVTYLNAKDRKLVDEAIEQSGMTASSYVRCVLLGRRIKSALDLKAVSELAKVNTEQTKLKGFSDLA